MKPKPCPELEKGRIIAGRLGSDASFGNCGVFMVTCPKTGHKLCIIMSDKLGWEHVSVSFNANPKKIPSWDDMAFVKDLIWEPEECAVQMHPPRSRYKNLHPGVLHIWKKIGFDYPLPPLEMV